MENLKQNINDDDVVFSSPSSSSSLQFYKKQKVESTNSKFKSPEIASATLMKYVPERNEKASQHQEIHPVDAFLGWLAPTLKSLSPYKLNIAKSKIFNVMQEIEMNEIMQQRYATPPETSFFFIPSSPPSPSPNYIPSPVISPINPIHTWPAEFPNSSHKNNSITQEQQSSSSFPDISQ